MSSLLWRLEVDRQHPDSIYFSFPDSDRTLIDQYLASQQTQVSHASEVLLTLTSEGCRVLHPRLKLPFELSYESGEVLRRAQRGAETLCRVTGATRGSSISILDATAGLGREAYLMASCGAVVKAVERVLPLYLLTQAALFSATHQFSLIFGETHQLTIDEPDVIYLDPMFPPKTKSSAAGKEAVILKSFAGIPSPKEEESLLTWALDHARCRVVVKRPIKASALEGPRPTSSVKGRAIRFDLYGKRKLPHSEVSIR